MAQIANQRQMVQERRTRRQLRVRRKLRGDERRPRLAVFRSSKHIYAQIINDEDGATLVAAGTAEAGIKGEVQGKGGNVAAASVVGRVIAERAKAKGIDLVCFDRRSYRYHGRVKALADAARQAGLQF
jgi:large subunit ribosomal protein L18